jgi:hypothetical protein
MSCHDSPEPVRQPPKGLQVRQLHLAGEDMTAGRRRRVDTIPAEQFAVVGANIRTLRLRNGWTQAELGELMGWPTVATVCGAEGHREGRQRGFTAEEVRQLAGIFGVSAQRLTTRCLNCDGNPPPGFVCLRCGARSQT